MNEEIQKAQQHKKKQEAFSQINQKSFLVIVVLLAVIIALCGILTNVIPQGAYQRDENGMIIDGTYQQLETKGIAFWRVITAPFRVFASEDAVTIIMISVFLLIMSGVFNLFEKTQGIRIIIQKTVEKFSSKKRLVVCVTAFIFMAFGSFFGMFEELVTLLPLIALVVVVITFTMGEINRRHRFDDAKTLSRITEVEFPKFKVKDYDRGFSSFHGDYEDELVLEFKQLPTEEFYASIEAMTDCGNWHVDGDSIYRYSRMWGNGMTAPKGEDNEEDMFLNIEIKRDSRRFEMSYGAW